MGVPSGRKPEKRKRIETVIGSLKSVWTTSIAETIIAWIAADLGSLVMVSSKVGIITNPELMFAVVSILVLELGPVPAELYGLTREQRLRPSVEAGNDVTGCVANIEISIPVHIRIK